MQILVASLLFFRINQPKLGTSLHSGQSTDKVTHRTTGSLNQSGDLTDSEKQKQTRETQEKIQEKCGKEAAKGTKA